MFANLILIKNLLKHFEKLPNNHSNKQHLELMNLLSLSRSKCFQKDKFDNFQYSFAFYTDFIAPILWNNWSCRPLFFQCSNLPQPAIDLTLIFTATYFQPEAGVSAYVEGQLKLHGISDCASSWLP